MSKRSEAAGAVRDDDQALVLYARRGSAGCMVIGSALLVAGCAWFALDPSTGEATSVALLGERIVRVVAACGAIFFAACLVWYFVRVVHRRVVFRADAGGLVDRASLAGAGELSWDEVRGYEPVTINGRRMLSIEVADPEAVIARSPRWRRPMMRNNLRLAGTPVQLPENAIGLTVEELIDEIARRRPADEAAKQDDAAEQDSAPEHDEAPEQDDVTEQDEAPEQPKAAGQDDAEDPDNP